MDEWPMLFLTTVSGTVPQAVAPAERMRCMRVPQPMLALLLDLLFTH